MDRRQQKTRTAIFSAFTSLLAEKSYSKITVQEIIDAANVGRTTFYAHFETKDDLLKELCEELFGHIIGSAMDCTHTHGLYSDGSAPESVFCHLLQHLQENDRNIIALLSCESSEMFLRFFKDSLNELVRSQFINQNRKANTDIPEDFLINHISGSFVEMVLWWIRGHRKQTPEDLDRYFRAVIEPII
ncbi:TetR/AcrR family transcriptional regulator [Intestinimonas aquisgranensis]|nr:TetR/AcrR family transcriptional regulator [Intestinimonas aquisgranensis]